MYRVVQWATGSMGRTALRRVIDHPDLELAGVYVYDARKVGVDAGEIARRPATGVRATNRIEDILARELSAAVTGTKTVKEALDAAEKAVNAAL